MVALITGAAEGIGRGLAFECATRGYDVIMASLPGEALDETCSVFEKDFPSIKVYKYGVNFLDDNAVEDLYAWVESKSIKVDALVNNVGLGSAGAFEKSEMSFFVCHKFSKIDGTLKEVGPVFAGSDCFLEHQEKIEHPGERMRMTRLILKSL